MVCDFDTDYTAASNPFVYTDHLFLGWNTKANGSGKSIAEGGTFRNLGSAGNTTVTLYAQWEDESGDVIETQWTETTKKDEDGDGTPDIEELKPGDFAVKDPSLKNHTDKEVYGYLLVSVPTVSAKLSSDQAAKVYDFATLNTAAHWTQVSAKTSSDPAVKSRYLYRYDAKLKAYGTAEKNPYMASRGADRTTDLLTGFTVQKFSSCGAMTGSIDVCGVYVEAAGTAAEADALAAQKLSAAGLW